ncbi:MAG TPA: phosphoenolpyruvate synthase [Candidatus Anoxymicrobiaceae bacterium]
MTLENSYVVWLDSVGKDDVELVGGKNANSGEMLRTFKEQGIRVPDGFATTAEAYWKFLDANGLDDKITSLLVDCHEGCKRLEETGESIRRLILASEFPDEIASLINKHYRELSKRYKVDEADVAVRSSATAEDLPTASFAGQQETFLNIKGEDQLLDACRKCYASLFTDRAISYRIEKGFAHTKVALSIGVQKMIRSDLAGSGVMFTLDTDTGFPEVVEINAAWGLGENVVQGAVNPDEYMVFKPLLKDESKVPIIEKEVGDKEQKLVYSEGGTATTRNVKTSHVERTSFVLNDEEILQLGRWAVIVEDHYKKPMDMEWAKDGNDGLLYMVQARPETVQSQLKGDVFKKYSLKEKGEVLLTGLAIGEAVASGKAQVIKNIADRDKFEDGAILVTAMTDPDWVPIMNRAAGIVTDHGGRTSHAAIVSRELGIPAIVGTETATEDLPDGEYITISCLEGSEGKVYKGELEYEASEIRLEDIPAISTPIMINLASPAAALRWWRLPVKGIGLLRMEFIINNAIKIHPMALVKYPDIADEDAKRQIDELTEGYDDKTEYFVDRLALGLSELAASQYPYPVIVRMSDFKTNEYANLIGGAEFEPKEENPMLGFRGASRYYNDRYKAGFALECRAIKRVREVAGLTNVLVMIPFCRTPEEADKVLEVLDENGLRRGENGLEVYVMCEIPSNVVLAEEFSDRFDGFSIGSNDLTQLTLGVDRDSAELAPLFDENNEAVKRLISWLITVAHKKNRKVGICGQAPSDFPDFAEFLVRQGIDSISLNPDSVISVIQYISKAESSIPANAT